jgi:signal transduction histidine kinase
VSSGVERKARAGETSGSPPGSGRLPQGVAAWREAFAYGLLIAALFIPFDFLYTQRLGLTLGARVALLATLGTCWWLLGRVGRRGAVRVVVAGATAAAILTPLTVIAASGSTGARFGFVLVVPFILLALLPDVPAIATAAGVIGAIFGGIALVRDGDPPSHVAEWITMAVAITGVTAYGARKITGLVERARTAERDRFDVVAQLEESERRRAASERLALVGRLAAGVGHEINNPLSAVKGNLACALEELERLDVAPGARDALAEALAASERIAWITADMRAFTGDAGAPLVACRVADAIRDALLRASDRLGGAKIILDVEPGLPCVRSEPRLLSDTIGRLAAQAAATGGIQFPGSTPTVRICARRADGAIEIAVDDEGPRIPAHVLPHVFEPFAAQGELRGAGLSLTLPLMRELAERGGGRVEAAWHDGGNRFILTLAASTD